MHDRRNLAALTITSTGELSLNSTGTSSFKAVIQAGKDVYITTINCEHVSVNGQELPIKQVSQVEAKGYRIHLQAISKPTGPLKHASFATKLSYDNVARKGSKTKRQEEQGDWGQMYNGSPLDPSAVTAGAVNYLHRQSMRSVDKSVHKAQPLFNAFLLKWYAVAMVLLIVAFIALYLEYVSEDRYSPGQGVSKLVSRLKDLMLSAKAWLEYHSVGPRYATKSWTDRLGDASRLGAQQIDSLRRLLGVKL
ncbi:MAG: hypothetical protein M1821_003630 [Bathelium mastoideum]|nr:MAG: hypothetical protein M1821_003630 [Bathelium mastoideum]KAI9684918.1 MAG: hypothetical protein M1822_005567 [Bathelium mastoideum]